MNLGFGGFAPLSAVDWHGRAVCTIEEAWGNGRTHCVHWPGHWVGECE